MDNTAKNRKRTFGKTGAMYAFVMAILMCMPGCGKEPVKTDNYKTYTFSVETGDKVAVKLDTSDRYDITSDVPFEISRDGEVQSQGAFISADDCAEYVNSVYKDENAEIIDSGKKGACEYVMWKYDNSEYNYVILIGRTGILLGNDVSEESARECFDRLDISIK